MGDSFFMRGFERIRNLFGNGQRFVERNRALSMRSASVSPFTSSITS